MWHKNISLADFDNATTTKILYCIFNLQFLAKFSKIVGCVKASEMTC